MRNIRVKSGRSRRTDRRLKFIGKCLGTAFLAVTVLCGVSFAATGVSDPGRPLHDRITPAPTAPYALPSGSPSFEVNAGDAERESHYLSHLKSRGMTNQNTTTSDYDMIAIGYMICDDFRQGENVTYDTERPVVEAYTDGDPVYASVYMDTATDILCKGVIDK